MTFPVLDAKATGERIKELRLANHLRVSDIAEFMGFESEQAVYKWQRGESLPTVDNLYALSRLFQTTVDDILRGSKGEDASPLLSVLKDCDIIYEMYDIMYKVIKQYIILYKNTKSCCLNSYLSL